MHKRDPLLRYGEPVVIFGSWACQADSLRGFFCNSSDAEWLSDALWTNVRMANSHDSAGAIGDY